jgi:hypothetical protein
MRGPEPLGSSFRDPSGFVFRQHGTVYRQVNQGYRPAYDHLLASGLRARLETRGQLLPFEEADGALAQGDDAYKVLRPQPLDFVSYPSAQTSSTSAATTARAASRRRSGL